MTFLGTLALVLVVNVAFIAAFVALAWVADRRRPKPSPRSQEAIIADVRGALDSGRLDGSIAKINRRNRQRLEA